MKYQKDVIVTALRNRLQAIEANEEKAYQRRLQDWETRKQKLVSIRESVSRAIRRIATLEADDYEGFQNALELVGEVAGDRSSYDRYLAERVKTAASELHPPVKSTENSEALRVTLDIFETGAPPEVSIQDLRGFGLLSIVKYGS